MALNTVQETRENPTDEEEFIREAKERFWWAQDALTDNHALGIRDLDVLDADQWDAAVKRDRGIPGAQRPMLTVNRLPLFTNSVIGDSLLNAMTVKVTARQPGRNDQRFNKPSDLANIRNGIINNIVSVSKAQIARQTAFKGAVNNGFGYYKIGLDFIDEDTFEKEIRAEPIINPFTVYFDPLYKKLDGSDAKFVFISEHIPRKEFKTAYPDLTPIPFEIARGDTHHDWTRQNTVRVAEYWVKRPFKKTIVRIFRPDKQSRETVDAAKWDKIKDEEEAAALEAGIPIPIEEARREIDSHVVVKYIIDGQQIIDGPKKNGKFILNFKDQSDIRDEKGVWRDNVWPGRTIPVIPVWGKVLMKENKRVFISVIRYAIDPQLMYNYSRTDEIEQTALRKLPPIMITPDQIKGHEQQWASRAPSPYKLYNHDPKGALPPVITLPPQASSANLGLSAIAMDEIKATTGIFDPSLGNRSNETSGVAIQARQSASDVGNFEYHDNLRRGIELEGQIYNEIIPEIYDSERTVTVLDNEGKESFAEINKTVFDDETQTKVLVNDMTQGKYKVTVTAGPAFSTQRAEVAETLARLAAGAVDPTMQAVLFAGTLRNMDFNGSEKMADIADKLLPPGLTEDDEQAKEAQRKAEFTQQQILDIEKDIKEQEAQKTEAEIKKLNAQTVQIEAETADTESEQKKIMEMVATTVADEMERR